MRRTRVFIAGHASPFHSSVVSTMSKSFDILSVRLDGMHDDDDILFSYEVRTRAVSRADLFVLVFSEKPDEVLVGYAYAQGVPVVVVTTHSPEEFFDLSAASTCWIRIDDVGEYTECVGALSAVIDACVEIVDEANQETTPTDYDA